MLKQLVYVSASAGLFDADALADILRVSRRNNAAVDVTGALLYADGSILQVLEGPAAAVDAVYARVERDPRHRRILKLVDRVVPQRAFPEWAMGLVRPEVLGAADREAVRTVREAGASRDRVVRHMVEAFLASTPEPRGGLARSAPTER